MIDWNRVEELRSEVGEDDFKEVAEIFLEEVDEVIGRLSTTPDIATFEEDLHFLKGSALNLGFETFSDICSAGEKAAASGNADTVDIGSVIKAYQTSRQHFTSRLWAAAAA